MEKLCPRLSPLLDIIQLSLHLSRETGIHDIGEVFLHDLVDRLTQPGWSKAPLFLVNVSTILNSTDDGHIRTWTTDTLLF